MARPAATDFLHSMRFHVTVLDNAEGYLEGGSLQDTGMPQAGFTTCSIPELGQESVEYKEGTYIYPRKYPGNPTVSDCSFARGVARTDSSFWDWARDSVEGGTSPEYRKDLQISHYHRDAIIPAATSGAVANTTQITAAKIYKCLECFPIRCKPAGDLDATSSEISIMEMDVAVERFLVIPPDTA
jgi:phage tail-like protein